MKQKYFVVIKCRYFWLFSRRVIFARECTLDEVRTDVAVLREAYPRNEIIVAVERQGKYLYPIEV